MTGLISKPAEAELLRQALEEIVRQACGGQSSIAAVQRSRSSYASYYGVEIVTVALLGGGEFKIFLKNFGSYAAAKDGMEQRRGRELHVCRDILGHSGLGTATYYGAVWHEPVGPFWLFLEFVEGLPVRYCSFEHWVEAAGWIGRAQGFFHRNPGLLNGRDYLLAHDAPFFFSVAERAQRALAQWSPGMSERLDRALCCYDGVVDTMTSQPKTLVHGAYRPGQILLRRRPEPPRICPVDWELAAIGSSFYDLAFLADGFKPPRLDDVLEAYRAEASHSGVPVPDLETVKYIVACYRLHKVLTWLSHSADRKFAEPEVVKLVGMAERLAGGELTPIGGMKARAP